MSSTLTTQLSNKMGKSYKHTPIGSVTAKRAGVMKKWKLKSRKALRRFVNTVLHLQEWIKVPHPKEYGNEWDSPRDGKSWYGYLEPHEITKENRK